MKNILDTLLIESLDTPKWPVECHNKFALRSFWHRNGEMSTQEIIIFCDKWELGQRLIELNFLSNCVSWSKSSTEIIREQINSINAEKKNDLAMFSWFTSQGRLFMTSGLDKIELTYIDEKGLEKNTNLDKAKIDEVKAYTYGRFFHLNDWAGSLKKAISCEIIAMEQEFLIINEAQKLDGAISKNCNDKNNNGKNRADVKNFKYLSKTLKL